MAEANVLTGAAGTASPSGSGAYMLAWDGTQWVPYLVASGGGPTLRTPNVFKSLSAVVVTSETTIWTPAAGKKFRLMGFYLTQGVLTGAVTLKDNTAGSTILVIPQSTIGVAAPLVSLGNGILSAAANNVLTATGATAETLTGFVFGVEE